MKSLLRPDHISKYYKTYFKVIVRVIRAFSKSSVISILEVDNKIPMEWGTQPFQDSVVTASINHSIVSISYQDVQ